MLEGDKVAYTLTGGSGDDTILAQFHGDTVYAGSGADVVALGGGNVEAEIRGEQQADLLETSWPIGSAAATSLSTSSNLLDNGTFDVVPGDPGFA